jgi:DNA segregation ATPase FtsK/SpoIIIE, S-DNA-T family
VAGRATAHSNSTGKTQKVSRARKTTSKSSPDPPARKGRSFRGIPLPERLRAEIIATLVFTLAVITALPQIGLAEDTLLELLTSGIASMIGRAVILVPFAISIIAVEIWRAEPAEQRIRRTAGGVLAGLSVVGTLALGSSDVPVSEAGGYVGHVLSQALAAIIGEIGTGILLFAVGLVAVFMVTGTDVQALRESWQRVTYRPPAEAVDEEQPDFAEDHDDVAIRTEQYDAAPVVMPPVAGTAEPEPAVRSAPFINIPGRDKPETIPVSEIDEAEVAEEVALVSPAKKLWRLPKLNLLERYKSSDPDSVDLESKARRIEETLASFKVEASVREIFPGPAVTLFALEPAMGVKVRRITELQNDLALSLAAPSIRIEAPVPGMARVGIEIPNASVSTVGLREVLESETFKAGEAKLPLPLGRDVNGRYIIGDLTRMPHLLIAGATGSGKSVCINSIIATFLLTKTPEELQMLLIDPKMVELVGFERVPHLKGPVVTDMDKVVGALRMVLREMERRYQLFARLGVRNIDGYNLRREDEPHLEKMPYLVVIIDELADLMMTTPEEVETLLVRLAQMARATGIHLLIATQRPSVDVLTGLIKANVPARIAFAVTSLTDSRVVLDMPGAERLLGRGDMLFMPPDAAKPHRIQGPYIDDRDLKKVVLHWRKMIPEMQFEPEWTSFPEVKQEEDDSEDALMEQAVEIVKQQGTASASMLQRRLRVGYNRAARMIESMEDAGIIGPADGPRGRTVLMDIDDE